MRQAFTFGGLSFAVGFIALAWPLLLSFVVGSVTATIWMYAFAMLLDVALFGLWVVLALRYARRAGNGELFDIPLVVRLTGASSLRR